VKLGDLESTVSYCTDEPGLYLCQIDSEIDIDSMAISVLLCSLFDLEYWNE